jgi:hypothetical protein
MRRRWYSKLGFLVLATIVLPTAFGRLGLARGDGDGDDVIVTATKVAGGKRPTAVAPLKRDVQRPPPALPNTTIPQAPGATPNGDPAAERGVVSERVIRQFVGSEGLRRMLSDGSVRLTLSAADVKHEVIDRYKSFPGGVVLEGTATGLGPIDELKYDRRLNAFLFDDRAAFFPRIPAAKVADVCCAIARDEKELIGVSLDDQQSVYGQLPKDGSIVLDLQIADAFLGDVVFAQDAWSNGYRFPDGFQPKHPTSDVSHLAVLFNFNGFKFGVKNELVQLAEAGLNVKLVPLAESKAKDGGFEPDSEAMSKDVVPAEFLANAAHLADHLDYYRRERLVDRVFAYGEVAAIARALKDTGFDLDQFARQIRGK